MALSEMIEQYARERIKWLNEKDYDDSVPVVLPGVVLRGLIDEIERQRGEIHSVHAHLNYLRSEIDRLRAKLAEYENVPVRLRHISGSRDGYEEAKQSNHE
jgi:hypothetical protein